jgi:hypothetical protein
VVNIAVLYQGIDILMRAVARLDECRSSGLVPRTEDDAKLIAKARQSYRDVYLMFQGLDTGQDNPLPHDRAIDPEIYPHLLKAFLASMHSQDMPADHAGIAVAWDHVIAQAMQLSSITEAKPPRPSLLPYIQFDGPSEPRRAPIAAEARRQALDRDGRRCVRCGATQDLAIDHIHPWSKGGPDDPENFQILCRACNSSKGASVVVTTASVEAEVAIAPPERLRPEERVHHPEYGDGTVTATTGDSPEYKASISFDNGLDRTFVVRRSPLRSTSRPS